MRLILAEPFKSLWAGRDAFEAMLKAPVSLDLVRSMAEEEEAEGSDVD